MTFLKNHRDKPIVSERSMLENRIKIERKFTQRLGKELIIRAKSTDPKALRIFLKNTIKDNILGLWLAGVELGNKDGNRELKLLGIDNAKFALRLENLPARAAIERRINLLAGNVTDSEFDRIKQALGENIKGDTSRADLVAAISEVLGGDRFTARARAIARTELTSAYNIGRVQTYRENEIQAVRRYCIRDERTCQTCAGLNGVVARLDGADLAKLLPPSHPNCRCVLSPVIDMQQLVEEGRKLRGDTQAGWELEKLSDFGYPCGNTFISDRHKCYRDPKTGSRLKKPIDRGIYDRIIRSKSKAARTLYQEREKRIRSDRRQVVKGWQRATRSSADRLEEINNRLSEQYWRFSRTSSSKVKPPSAELSREKSRIEKNFK